MSRNGVYCLQKLIFKYNPNHPTSKGVREFIESGLSSFRNQNPQIDVAIEKASSEPHLIGQYVNGYFRNVTLKQFNKEQVLSQTMFLRNQWGSSPKNPGTKIYSKKKSIQGMWDPNTTY
eukprot:TRINITY_DN3527_c0_g1_i2.p1 TRINITY_DN3527_c0_g1~~TRINITY_DN3527_c0_g1_i2.p1  ORF type:complete len:119 (+),score=33.81 TRINITY_DN3527_c0_g1_i2:380-736(+)